MTLARVLEPEVMDTADEARDYDAMDHAEVNRAFVRDLLAVAPDAREALDLGTGTAQIPIELCSQRPACRVMAVDLSLHMLELARYNVEVAGLIERIMLDHVDAKGLPYEDGQFPLVISNSIVHHIPHPAAVLAEAVRVTAAEGLLFFRDLMRPPDEATLSRLVDTYAGQSNAHQRAMFSDSLRAALTLEEIQQLVQSLGFSADTVRETSDRHWTWTGRRPGPV